MRLPALIATVAAVAFVFVLRTIFPQVSENSPTRDEKLESVIRMNELKSPDTLCGKLLQDYSFEDGQEIFNDFNNVTGANCFIVPNIIHFIRFNQSEYSFIDYVVMMAAMRNHRPDWFYIHTNVPEFKGKYWEKLMNDSDIAKRIIIKQIELPYEVFGQQLNTGWRLQHGSDVARLQVIMKYGGIYLDNDEFVIRNLDRYRRYEAAVNWDENQFLGNQVIIANKHARVLTKWFDTYRVYKSDQWYYNGGERPTVEVLYKHPELIHRVKGGFGVDNQGSHRLYTVKDYDGWRKLDTIHLLIRKRSHMFTEETIKMYEYPFGTMVRELLDESPEAPLS